MTIPRPIKVLALAATLLATHSAQAESIPVYVQCTHSNEYQKALCDGLHNLIAKSSGLTLIDQPGLGLAINVKNIDWDDQDWVKEKRWTASLVDFTYVPVEGKARHMFTDPRRCPKGTEPTCVIQLTGDLVRAEYIIWRIKAGE